MTQEERVKNMYRALDKRTDKSVKGFSGYEEKEVPTIIQKDKFRFKRDF